MSSPSAGTCGCQVWRFLWILTLALMPSQAAAQQPPDASGEDSKGWSDPVEVRWTYRVVGAAGFSRHLFEQQRPTRSENFFGGIHVLHPIRVADRLYIAPGGQIGYGVATAGRCSTALVCGDEEDEKWCTCPGEMGRWTAKGLDYGVSLGLGFKTTSGTPYIMFWAPMLRLQSIAGRFKGDAACERQYDGCDGTAAANVIVTAGPEWDLVHSGAFGCTFGIGIGTVLGDLASRDGIRPVYAVHFGYGLNSFAD